LNCAICETNSSLNNIDEHFHKYHPKLLNTNTIVDIPNQIGGDPNNEFFEYGIIKENSIVTIYLTINNINGARYIIRRGKSNINEITAHELLTKINSTFMAKCLPKIYYHFINRNSEEIIITEYIDGYNGYELNNIPELSSDFQKNKMLGWICLIRQLAYFIDILEKNQINHNDFGLKNIMIEYCPKLKKFQLKILNLEKMTNHKNSELSMDNISRMTGNTNINNNFYRGIDLNLVLGELVEKYYEIIPKIFLTEIQSRIKKSADQSSYKISDTNVLTTGSRIIQLSHKLERNVV